MEPFRVTHEDDQIVVECTVPYCDGYRTTLRSDTECVWADHALLYHSWLLRPGNDPATQTMT